MDLIWLRYQIQTLWASHNLYEAFIEKAVLLAGYDIFGS